MRNVSLTVFRSACRVLLALCLFPTTAFALKNIENKAELIQALDESGLKVGAVVWLRSPMNDLPGLSKIRFTDADVRPKYEFSTSDNHLVLIAEVEGKGEVILEISRYAFLYEPGDTVAKFYFADPSRQVAKWGKRVLKAISERQVLLGMTEEQVSASWGQPAHINTSGGKWGRHAQWVFGDSPSSYLYFENGRLSSWQD